MSIKSVITIMAAVIVLLSCSCENENNPTQQPGTKKAYGVFSLMIDQNVNGVGFFGQLIDGPAPFDVWDTVMTSGECKLVKPKLKNCDNCGFGYVCVDDNNCQPEPDTITAGTVTVTGFTTRAGTTTSTMTPALGTYQPTGDNRPANPPCTEGGTISLTASGNQSVNGFTLSAKTISKIEISEDTIPMNPGEDIHITWKAAANQTDSRINVIVDLLCVGGTKAKIECDCPDDGELTIPAKMLDSLKTFGMSGHPLIEIYRRSIGTNPTACVQLMIQTHAIRFLKIPGLIPCSTDGETSNCPSGMTCVNERCVDGNDTTLQTVTKKAYGPFELFIDQLRDNVSFIGKLSAGPIPVAVWDTVMTSGECRLIKPKLKRCNNCGFGYVCVDDNNCQPEPDTITAGTVTVTGFTTRAGTTTSTMTPVHGTYQPAGDNRPANPPCTEGKTISLTASGNQSVNGFTLSAKTISKIEISEDTIPMNPGEDIHLTWKAAANQTDSRIKVILDISYHGGTKAKIDCDCIDDGDLTIPAKMLDSLKTFGMAGSPKLEIYRKSVGTDPSTGVQLIIQSYVVLWLKIPGLISCTDGQTNDCPSGMTCVDQRCVDGSNE